MGVDRAWKKAERRVCRLYGVERRPGSGAGAGPGLDDALDHPKLWLEIKHGKAKPRFQDVEKAALERGSGKVPVLVWWPPRVPLRKVLATMRLVGLLSSITLRPGAWDIPFEDERLKEARMNLIVQVPVVDHARLVRGKP